MTILNFLKRRWISASVLAALTLAPTLGLVPAEARPSRTSSYGYRRNRRVVVERFRPRYRSTPRYSTYRRTYRRSYSAPPRYRGRYVTRYRNGRAYRVYVR